MNPRTLRSSPMNLARQTFRTRRHTWAVLLSLTLGALALPASASAQPAGWTATSKFVEPVDQPAFSWDPTRFGIALEGRALWLRNDAAQRLAGSTKPASSGVSLLADVYRPTAELSLRVDASLLSDSTSRYQQQSYLAETLTSDLVAVGVSARYQVLRWLAPYARLSGGLGWERLSLRTNQGELKDRQTFAHGTVGAGLFLSTPCLRFRQSMSWPRVRLIAQIEGGYFLAGAADWTLTPSRGSGGQAAIPSSPVALGHASRSAPYGRLSFGLGF
jgi:hypothetical protein